MEWPWVFLYLCLHLTGCHQTPTLFQNPPRSVALINSSMEMVCMMKREQLAHLGIYWYRRNKDSQDFQHILFSIMQKSSHSKDIDKVRYSVSKESFRNSYTLKISKLQPGDSGTYYCALSQSSELLFGNGTELSVVDSLPPTEKPTEKTSPPKKPLGCRTSSKHPVKGKGSSCSGFIWVPLVACAVILLLSLAAAIRRFQRLRRRMQLHFRKQVLK